MHGQTNIKYIITEHIRLYVSVNRRRDCSIRTRAAAFCSRRLCCRSFCIIVWLWQNQRIKRMRYKNSSTLTLHCQSLSPQWVFRSRIRHLTVISAFFGVVHKQYHNFKICVFWYVMLCCWASSFWRLEDSTTLWNTGNNQITTQRNVSADSNL